MRVDSGSPLVVFAARDGDSLKALLPNDRQEKGAMRLAGIFLPGQERNFVVLRIDVPGSDQGYHLIYHEYVHMAVNLNFPRLPLWLSEGLADFFAFATISEGKSGLGRTSREFLEMLKTSPMIPLPILMTVTPDSPYYRQQDKSKIFYAESWALTHYLILGDKQAHAKQLIEFFGLVRNGVSEQEAMGRSFGDLQVLQRNLEKYILSDRFYYSPVETKLRIKDNQYTARTLSTVESLATRGEFLVHTNRLDEAKAMLVQALQLDPRSALANEGMGLLFLRLQNTDQAKKYFLAAAELDSKSFLAQYYAAYLAYERGDHGASEGYLRKVLAINPQFAPACSALSQLLMTQEGKLPEALELAKKAADLEPAELSHLLNFGRISMEMGRYDEAHRAGERVLALARTEAEHRQAEALLLMISDHQERILEAKRRAEILQEEAKKMGEALSAAMELKTPLGNQDITPSVSKVKAGPAGTVGGIIRSIRCDYPAIMDVVLDSNGEQHRLRAENYIQVQYRSAGAPLRSGFQPCTELEGKRVQIEFLSVSGQEYSGLIKTVAIEKQK